MPDVFHFFVGKQRKESMRRNWRWRHQKKFKKLKNQCFQEKSALDLKGPVFVEKFVTTTPTYLRKCFFALLRIDLPIEQITQTTQANHSKQHG